jgi:hypothetical protein
MSAASNSFRRSTKTRSEHLETDSAKSLKRRGPITFQ